MGVQSSCDKSANNCADEVLRKFQACEDIVHTAENSGYGERMLHEPLLNQELLRAAMEGHPQSAARQLERGAFVETRRPFTIAFEGDRDPNRSAANMGLTPLMHAALGGHVDTCSILLTAGAKVNAEDEDGMRPLHFAAKAGSLDVFKMLLLARADADCQDTDGLTPLAQLAPWCKSARADFEALLITHSRNLLLTTAAGAATGAAAAAGAIHGTPGSQDPRLLKQEPSLVEVLEVPEASPAEVSACSSAGALDNSNNTCTLSHASEAVLAALDGESSDETAIPEGLLQEPRCCMRESSYAVRELTLLGERNDAVSLLDEANELHKDAEVEIPESFRCSPDSGAL